MRSDSDIKHDVEEELKWIPELKTPDIGVAVKNRVVTLSGFVCSYDEKYEAEAAAKRVLGVRGVANDLPVRCRAMARGRTPTSLGKPSPRSGVARCCPWTRSRWSSRKAGSRSRGRWSGTTSGRERSEPCAG